MKSIYHNTSVYLMRIRGINSVNEALKTGKVNGIYVSSNVKSKRIVGLIESAKKMGIPIFYSRNLRSNVEADISPIKYVDFEYLIEKALREEGVLIFLDSVQDPQNLGAVVRNAVFFGCSGIVIPKRRGIQITDAVVRASVGAVFHTNISRVSNLANSIKKLKKFGFMVVGAETDGKSMEDVGFHYPIGIAVGGEDEGLSKPVRKQCDEVIKIKPYGEIESLNLSDVLSVILYEVRRRLG